MPQLIASEVAQQLGKQIGVKPDASGHLTTVLGYDDDGFTKAIAKGLGSAFIEVGSERAGGPLTKGMGWAWSKLPGGAKTAAMKAAIVQKWLGKPGRRVEDIGKKIAWDGVVGEVLEEEFGRVARAATGIEQLPTFDQWKQELLVEAASMAIPGVAFGISSRAENAQQQAQATTTASTTAADSAADSATDAATDADTHSTATAIAATDSTAIAKDLHL